MDSSHPRTGTRHAPNRVHEHAPDPAEAANRPLEPKVSGTPLKSVDAPEPGDHPDRDPHARLNTAVGEPDPVADSDPYRGATPDDEADRASGTRGANQGAER